VRFRRIALTFVVLLCVTLPAGLTSTARAQVTQPEITGHGTCHEASARPVSFASFTVEFDAFLLQRAAQIRAAAARWLPQRSAAIEFRARGASALSRVPR
jgi:hypothetical protein